MNNRTPIIVTSILVLGIVIILFGFFVWPTEYRYDKLADKYPVRINRITGATDVLYADGWQPVGNTSTNGDSKTDVNKQSNMIPVGTSSVTLGSVTINDIQVSGDNITCQVVNNSTKPITVYSLSAETYDSYGNVLQDQPNSPLGSPTLNPNQSAPMELTTLAFGKA